ncbi:AzlC family ABC transporter permease [Halalkalirubrum salinum]|uniref:AzlC family ABC transporter permease n=1 Tax=Halalkalirubrum salinum TaxID=2563889 RepID=UPI0010FBBC74|nr:AzlC family ABC transporter permease [Halalkalirubrum salinum]
MDRRFPHPDLLDGIRVSGPILLGIIPFAMVAGISAANAGMTVIEAVGMSVFVFAGASQLAAIDLIDSNAPFAVVVVTAVIINVRMLMYSASIAPYFQALSTRVRALLAYVLTDQAYAMSVAEYERKPERSRLWYYSGIGFTLWIVWQIGTFVGAVVGAGVPEALGLEFALPLVFLALLVPAMKDRGTTTAAIVAGAVALGAAVAGVPLSLDLPIAAVCGILAGIAIDAWGNI